MAGILTGDAALVGQALDSDVIIEPVRGPLIPGFAAVKAAAKTAGTYSPLASCQLPCSASPVISCDGDKHSQFGNCSQEQGFWINSTYVCLHVMPTLSDMASATCRVICDEGVSHVWSNSFTAPCHDHTSLVYHLDFFQEAAVSPLSCALRAVMQPDQCCSYPFMQHSFQHLFWTLVVSTHF